MTGQHFYVGTDIGGTFTDMVVIDDAGGVRLFKAPTTPDDRSSAVIDAFGLAAEQYGLSLGEFARRVRYFAHGTTAATNTLIEQTGATTALITTRGAGDSLLIQRATASWAAAGEDSGHYSARRNPVPLVPRRRIYEIDERTDAAGAEIVRLNAAQITAAVTDMKSSGVATVAVCFLWSFLDPAHERQAADVIRAAWPEVFLSLSSDIAPVIGEYERAATTVINAYLGPVITRYVERLEERLRAQGFAGEFTVMDSAGGVTAARAAARRAVELVMSGPAGGVLACAADARAARGNIVTADMGGTSFDVGLVVGGRPLVATSSFDGGYHVVAPRVAVTARGAGGGSIAAVDNAGVLVVGPQSAGSVPGPACYAKGGLRPTVTDADVVLGIIDPGRYLGGRMPLSRKLAEDAIGKHIAEPLGLTVTEAAAGIRQVIDAQMADQIRAATIQAGHDPRDFVLYAYGGAGGTHAYAFARDLGITEVVVPYTATVHSAYGAVCSDWFRLHQVSDRQRTPAWADDPADHLDFGRIGSRFATLEDRCRADFPAGADVRIERYLYFRYRGQANEVPIPVTALDPQALRSLVEIFHREYERLYGPGTSLREAGVEIGTFRVEGRMASPVPGRRRPARSPATSLAGARTGQREVIFDGVSHPADVFDGEAIPGGSVLSGPAIIDCLGTTVVVGVGQRARVDENGTITLSLGAPGPGSQ